MPAGYGQMMMTKRDYELYTEPQVNAGGKRKYWPRARMLGGCTFSSRVIACSCDKISGSAMNAMMFHTGSPSDYDEWATLQNGQEGASSWAHKDFHR